jgi:hypothetical protein
MRLRAFRYLSERYAKRERPIDGAAEFLLFALIVLTVTWPMFTLAHALGLADNFVMWERRPANRGTKAAPTLF